MGNIKTTNLRFNLDNENHQKAWQYLQDRDRKEYPSYSETVVAGLVSLAEKDAGETGLLSEAAVSQIKGVMKEIIEETISVTLEHMLPAFLSGCLAGITLSGNTVRYEVPQSEDGHESEEDRAEDVFESTGLDLEFLGID